MPVINLPNIITEDMLIDYTIFTVANDAYVNDQQPVKNLEASKELVNFIISTENYTPYAHLGVDETMKIGYNLSIDVDSNGLTENEAYNIFIDQLKIAERKLKKLIPLDTLTQSQYDALLSVYYRTDDFKKIGSEQRRFDVYEFVKNRQWDYYATALTNCGEDRNIRQLEAKILMLGDYGIDSTNEIEFVRSFIKSASLKRLERDYPRKMTTDKQKLQAERVYFVETKRFLPGMDQSRMRLVKQLG